MGISRAPSEKVRKARAAIKRNKLEAKSKAKQAEEKLRKSGGYGVATVSIHSIPPGGIKNSPAYRLVLAKCGGGTKLPAPELRAGAPLKGGFPLNKYPPNVLVDADRAFWLPDDWAQVIKNTGPGGTYLGWMSPNGKFFYHRKGYPTAIEETLGRKLTAKDGFNGILRLTKDVVKPNADKAFLHECLTPGERKHIVPDTDFHFAIVSARRASHDQGIQDLMLVESFFKNAGVTATWYVDAESLQAYKDLGLNAKVGGKLTPSRNMALNDAEKLGKRCVQVSDDISRWTYLNIEKQDLRGEKTFDKANRALAGANRYVVSPVAAAQFILAKMRSSPRKPQLGGVYCTGNAAMVMGADEYSTEHFILGDFFVVDSSPCRFDESMTLKEDYDFTASHIEKHGSVLRCNRMLLSVKHATNKGGAVATRDESGSKEQYNIKILQTKWPGVFTLNKKRANEVLMYWSHRCSAQDVKGSQRRSEEVFKSTPNAKSAAKVAIKGKVKKISFKSASTKVAKPNNVAKAFPLSAVLSFTGKEAKVPYITQRCKKHDKRTVQQVLGTPYVDASGSTHTYGYADLRYDIDAGRLKMMKGNR